MKEIQTQIKHNSIENGIDRNFIQNKAQNGIKNRKLKQNSKIENVKAAVANTTAQAAKIAGVAGKTAATTLEAAMPSGAGNTDDIGAAVADDFKRTAADLGNKVTDYAQNSIFKAAERFKSGNIVVKPQMSVISKKRIKAISNNKTVIQKAVSSPTILHSVNRSIKRVATNKIQSAKQKVITATAKKSVTNLVSAVSSVKVSQKVALIKSNDKKRKLKNSKVYGSKDKIKAVTEKAVAVAEKTAETTQKGAAAFTSNDSGSLTDVGEDFSQQTKNTASKFADRGIEQSTQGVRNISKSIKNIRTATLNTPSKGVSKTLHTVQKRTIQKSAKTTGKVGKKTIKTAKRSAKAAAKATKAAAKTTVKVTKAVVDTTSKIVSGIAKAIGALMSTPAGPIILVVLIAVIVLIILVSVLTNLSTGTTSAVAAIVSPLDWIFGNSASSSTEDLKDTYDDYLDMAAEAYKDLASSMEEKINDYSLDDNDILEFNGASITPASSAALSVKEMLQDSADDIDWTYFIEVYYIYMQRTVDNPELTKDGMYSFMVSYYYSLETSSTRGITCPTADCQSVTWYHPSGKYCPDVEDYDEESDTPSCAGHTEHFCPGNHRKVTINFEAVPNILDVLGFTDEEKEKLELGLSLLDEIFPDEP